MTLSFLSFGLNKSRDKIIATTIHRFSSTMIIPRAAVAATIQWTSPRTEINHYLLVQRKNPPDEGKWSIAGGKIILGEPTLAAAIREIREETQLCDCLWHPNSFLTTDAIVADDEKGGKKDDTSFLFHYVIAHCFAKAPACPSGNAPTIVPSDDALDAKWYTLAEINELDCSEQTSEVLQRAEELSDLGLLPVSQV